MKRKLLLLMAPLMAASFANAQSYFSASGGGAPNWTMTDYTGGTTVTLADIQAENKIVLYDYYFTTCFYCGQAVSPLEEILTEHGPDGTNTLEVFSLDVNPGTHGTKSIDEYRTEHGATNLYFDIETDYASEYTAWFYSPFSGGGGSSYGTPHFIAVCPDGTWESLFQDEVFPGSASTIQSDIEDHLNSACPSAALNLITLDKETIELTVVPNPTTDYVTINTHAETTAELTVTNMMGKVVHTGEVTEEITLDVTDYAKGVYIVNVQSEGTSVTERFIVK